MALQQKSFSFSIFPVLFFSPLTIEEDDRGFANEGECKSQFAFVSTAVFADKFVGFIFES